MNSAVLTFPGHFFQTLLCLRSLRQYYPEHTNRITVIADDIQCEPWNDYAHDLQEVMPDCDIVLTSTLPGIRNCVAGWWRQQLVKLTLDKILPDKDWFVVDGDVIFHSRCEVLDRVPISRRYEPHTNWSRMCVNYVNDVLGITQGTLQDGDRAVITSPIPFRHLTQHWLQSLRNHVENRFQNDFVDLHLAWFQDQTIVADIDPPTKWVMSEWELLECYRRFVVDQQLPFEDIGSGYQIDADLNSIHQHNGLFQHSYQRDAAIGTEWFQQQGLTIDPKLWSKCLDWYEAREVRRLV